jgi:hypothetical protein
VADKDPLILDMVNGRVLDGADLDEYYVSAVDYESPYWDDIDLEDTFDLPPVLPPVRLPEEAELAAQARRSALLADRPPWTRFCCGWPKKPGSWRATAKT